MGNSRMFENIFLEAPEDEAPADTGGAPDMPEDVGDQPSAPDMPDMPSDDGDPGGSDESPPDIPDDEEDLGGFEDENIDAGDGDENDNGDSNGIPLKLNDKVSAIMNMNLYQKFLSMLNTISTHQSMLKSNSDILYSIASDVTQDFQTSLTKLDENIRLYLNSKFLNENYSRNLLFFNKCLNLLKLLDDNFEKQIKKGIKGQEN